VAIPRRLIVAGLPRVARRVPGLKHVPVVRLLAVAELALLAHDHARHLSGSERRRLAQLVRRGRGMTPAERGELRALLGKLEGRAFAGAAFNRLTPLNLPKRFTRPRR
jgi:hypothetical protein